MTAARKFIFETNFDDFQAPEPKPEEIVEEAEPVQEEAPTYSEDELNAAREEALVAGRKEGANEAADASEREIAAALAAIEGGLSELFRMQEEANDSMLKNAISVAATVARKLFPDLNRKNALGEVENLVVTTMEKVMDEPKVTVNVAEELRPGLEQRIDSLIKGCEGKLMVRGDADMALGDCKIEWNEGGAERNTDAMWKEIDLIIEHNIGGDDQGAGDESSAAAGDPDRGAEAPVSAPPPETEQAAPPEAGGDGAQALENDSDTSGEEPPNG